jgi:hypothetical protein
LDTGILILIYLQLETFLLSTSRFRVQLPSMMVVTKDEHTANLLVALSTTEAEFANLTAAALSAQWVARILEECGAPQPKPTILFTDSLNDYGLPHRDELSQQGAHSDCRHSIQMGH